MEDIYEENKYIFLSGKEFNEIFKDRIFCKFLHDDLKHFGFQYKEKSLNVDVKKFCDSNRFDNYGLFFFDFIFFRRFINYYGKKIAFVTIPDDAKVNIFSKDRIRADKIYLSQTYEIDNETKMFSWLEVNKKNKIFDMNKLMAEIIHLVGYYYLSNINSKYKNYKFYSHLINLNPTFLAYVPKKYKTYELCKNALDKNNSLFPDIPENILTKELCLLSFSNLNNLSYLPERFKTYDIYIEFIKNTNYKKFLSLIPLEILDLNMCLLAVEKEAYSLCLVPTKFRTIENLPKFMKANPKSIEYLDEKFKTFNICLLALKYDYKTIDYIPYNFIIIIVFIIFIFIFFIFIFLYFYIFI
jgi:hypothetical protein